MIAAPPPASVAPDDALAARRRAVHGRIVDLDGHVMFGDDVAAELLGPALGAELVAWMAPLLAPVTAQHRAEARERALDDPGAVRGWLALGAVDVADRLAALDRLGFDRQLVLPPVAWPTLDTEGPEAAATRMRYNAWICDWAAASDRLVAVGQLAMHDPDDSVRAARFAIDRGVGAVEVPFAAPPAGVSPGDRSWDPLWALLADAGVAVVLHLGGGGAGTAVPAPRMFLDPNWNRLDHLQQPAFPSGMTQLRDNAMAGPVSLATLHVPAEVWCTSLVLGGALERHPGLRLVVLEMGAQWVPSWVERLDAVARSYALFGLPPLGLAPSDVIRRQVRVCPFAGNDVGAFVAASGLREVFSFASDYPHAEGGRDPVGAFLATFAGAPDGEVEAFFVGNAGTIGAGP